jgi:hypothetical protein
MSNQERGKTMKTLSMAILAVILTVSNVEANAREHNRVDQKHAQERVDLTLKQKQLLTSALETAKKDGHKDPYLLPGLIMHESTAGTAEKFRTARHKPSYDQSVGVAQILPGTASGVLKRHPDLKGLMKSKNVASELANNDKFNVAIASNYLNDLVKGDPRIGMSNAYIVAAYNTGHFVKKPEKMKYVKLVQKSTSFVRKSL